MKRAPATTDAATAPSGDRVGDDPQYTATLVAIAEAERAIRRLDEAIARLQAKAPGARAAFQAWAAERRQRQEAELVATGVG